MSARVRSLHVQNKPADKGQAGDRCALNLLGERITKESIHRGDMVIDPELHAPTDRIDARLRLLPSETRPVKQWFPARLHHASTEVGAHIVLLGEGPIAPGETADVQLVLDRPIAAAIADRFVILDRGRVVLEANKRDVTSADILVKEMQGIARTGKATITKA